MDDLLDLWRRALTCELAWVTESGQLGAMAAIPLVHDDEPCVALPYSLATEAATLRRAVLGAFTVTDGSVRAPEGGAYAIGPLRVVDDVGGEVFASDLLPQELLKYPPSRALADTLLLRQENWWWLPRIVVTMTSVRQAGGLRTRDEPARDAVLVRAADTAGLEVDVVTPADGWERPQLQLPGIGGSTVHGRGEAAIALGHAYSLPDLERWETWTVRGTIRGDVLVVTDRDGQPGASLEPLRLLQRMRRQRALEQACRRGIEHAERIS